MHRHHGNALLHCDPQFKKEKVIRIDSSCPRFVFGYPVLAEKCNLTDHTPRGLRLEVRAKGHHNNPTAKSPDRHRLIGLVAKSSSGGHWFTVSQVCGV
jgi:hypothetical protein